MSNFKHILNIVFCIILINNNAGSQIPDNIDKDNIQHADFIIPENKLQIDSTNNLFELIPSSHSGLSFKNEYIESSHYSIYNYIFNSVGGSAAIGDINNDGLLDIYISSIQCKNKLYLNKGDFKFTDISELSGTDNDYGFDHGVTMVDINNDGYLDIYIAKGGSIVGDERKNILFINQGDLTFKNEAKEFGLDQVGCSTQTYFMDIDKDDDLDIYFVTYPGSRRMGKNKEFLSSIQIEKNVGGISDLLYENKNGKYTDITDSKGIHDRGHTHSIISCDFENDNSDEIYVCNDFIEGDKYYVLNKSGVYKNLIQKTSNTSNYSMGSDFADINNDGFIDFVTADICHIDDNLQKVNRSMRDRQESWMTKSVNANFHYQMRKNSIHLNLGNGSFTDIGCLAGVAKAGWSWSTLFMDIDLDGFKDLFISNGFSHKFSILETKMIRSLRKLIRNNNTAEANKIIKSMDRSTFSEPNKFYKNINGLEFEDMTEDWAFGDSLLSITHASAYADFDKDGDLDLLCINFNQEPFLFKNLAREKLNRNYLSIELDYKKMNKEGIGSSVYLIDENNNLIQRETMFPQRGYLGKNESIIHFGLGNMDKVPKLQVIWNDGNCQEFKNVLANQRLVIKYEKSNSIPIDLKKKKNLYFQKVESNIVHTENKYNDFSRDNFIHNKRSMLGPGIAIIKNETYDSIYISQSSDLKDNDDELGVIFLNEENLKVKGGNQVFTPNEDHQFALVEINSGDDNLIKNNWNENGSSISATKLSKESGHFFYFIGVTESSGEYPLVRSKPQLITKQGGSYKNVINDYFQEDAFENLGPINSTLWTDIDNDLDKDLIIMAEWSPITIFENVDNKSFKKIELENISQYKGLWKSIVGGDFDKDGDIDFVLGNQSENFYYKPSTESPMVLYLNDFDNDKTLDKIYTINDKMIIDYISFRRKFKNSIIPDITHEEFLTLSINDKLGHEKVLESNKFTFNYSANTLLINEGNKSFSIEKLPPSCQFSPYYGMAVGDFDHDGNTDVVAHGNDFEISINFNAQRTGNGDFLKGNGNLNFQVSNCIESGFKSDLNGRSLAVINDENKSYIAAANNNGPLNLFEIKKSNTENKKLIFKENESYALIHYKNGEIERVENYIGGSYLSQQFQYYPLTSFIDNIKIYDFSGNERILK